MNSSRDGAIESIQLFTWYEFKAKFGSRQAKPKTCCDQEQGDKPVGPLGMNGTFIIWYIIGEAVWYAGEGIRSEMANVELKKTG